MTSPTSLPKSYNSTNRPHGFLPLNTNREDVMSTRRQTLPALISSHSNPVPKTPRTPRSFSFRDGPHDEEAYGEQGRLVMGRRGPREGEERSADERRMMDMLMSPQMRSMRLIGNSNPKYQWERYWKSEDDLKKMKKPVREYYERTNSLVQQYIFIDRLLDSSLPHDLIQEYTQNVSADVPDVPETIDEDPGADPSHNSNGTAASKKITRTPKAIYRAATETTPLFAVEEVFDDEVPKPDIPDYEEDDNVESGDPIVTLAIYINLAANFFLLAGKIVVIVLTSSLSVLASLVDAALDFLSTAIVWTTTMMIARQDQYAYPVGRRRLEPIGVLVFSVIMITSFFQVGLECISRLNSGDHSIVQLSAPAIVIMASTVIIKAGCWVWCRLINNSSVQALAQDAMTDVVFNVFSIIFPLVGYYAQIWWLDALGGLLLSLYVIVNWSFTTASHIRNLTGAAASADELNVLLYLTMRFAKTIKQIQGLQAYHAGDKLIVEVDIVLDENTNLRDSHDLGESLQYVIESVPTVDRAFVHQDYSGYNLAPHMQQQD